MNLHFLLQLGLVGAYVFTPFEIQWVGLIVAALYGVIYVLLTRHMGKLGGIGRPAAE